MTKGVLSGWHNLSTNGTLNVNGVSVQDILSILKTIKSDERFIAWREVLDDMYAHVVNQNNPHHVTTDQLATTVIQLIYEAWLLEGYSGELQYFIDLLYRYIEYADEAIMDEGISEVHVPTVYVLTQYIEKHNTNPDAHDDQINPYFLGSCDVKDPALSCRQLVGLTNDEISYLNTASGFYENIPLQNEWAADEFAFVLSFKFVEQTIFQYQNSKSTVIFRITSQPSQSRILFTRCIANNQNGNFTVPITTDLTTLQGFTIDHVAIPNDKAVAKCVLMSKGSKVTYALYSRSADVNLNVNPQIIDIDVDGTPVQISLPTTPKPLNQPKISFSKMESGNPLTDLIYYPQYLTIENLLYVFEWLDGNFREFPVVLTPEDPDNPVIIDQPNDPTEPDTAPVVFLTGGDIGTFKVSSTAELWRSLPSPSLEDIVSLVTKDDSIFAATRDNGIYIQTESGWNLTHSFEDIKINKFWYSDGIFVIVGTYDVYLPENSGIILVSLDGYEWSVIWEDWGPAFHDCCCGSYVSQYYRDLMFVFVGDGGRVGYIEAEYIYDFPYGTTIPAGPTGVCDLKCVTYGNNIYIAAGTGAMVTRAVGQGYSWSTPIQVGADSSIVWRHIEFLNPEFLLIGDGGYISKSIDGITWSTPIQINPLADPVLCSWYDAIYDHDTIALVGNSGRITRSLDYMKTWTPTKQISDHALNSVISRNHKDVDKEMLYAVDGKARVLTSQDMLTWSEKNLAFDISWYHLIQGNGIFVACGSKGTISYSTDGENWSQPLSIADDTFQLAEFIDDKFYLITTGGAIYVSSNGRDWSYLRTLPQCGFVGYAAHGLSGDGTGKFIVAFGNYYYRSLDGGLTWTKVLFSSGYWMSSAYGNGKWVLVGMAGKVSYSSDTLTWSTPTTPLGLIVFNDVAFGNGKFVAVMDSNKVGYSSDGITWSSVNVGLGSWGRVTFNGDRFIISNDNQIAESLDGVTWSDPVSYSATLTDVIYSNNYYHALRENGETLKGLAVSVLTVRATILMSLAFHKMIFGYVDYDWYKNSYVLALAQNGLYSYYEGYYGWTSVYMSHPHHWIAGTFSGTVWTLVAEDGAVVSSYDDNGWDWSYDPVIFSGYVWKDIKAVNGTTVIVGTNGALLCYDDPRNMGTPIRMTSKNWIKILHDGTRFIIVSDDGFISTSEDGLTWTTPFNTQIGVTQDMCYGDGQYIVLNTFGEISRSADLQVWTTPFKVGTELWEGIVYAKYKYILYASSSLISISETGLKWREYSTTNTPNFMDIEVGPLIVLPPDGYEYEGGGAPS